MLFKNCDLHAAFTFKRNGMYFLVIRKGKIFNVRQTCKKA